jgi:type VI secretion system secreted protein Hcp
LAIRSAIVDFLKNSSNRNNDTKTMKNPLTRFSSTLALVAPTMALLAPNADAAAYIKFDGVDGESTAVDHKDWIVVDSMTWGVAAVSPAPTGAPPKVAVRDFTITHRIDKASPKLFLACATGQTIPTVTLSVTRTVAGTEVGFYQIILTDVLVSSVTSASAPDSAGTSGDERPQESLSLNYTKIEIKYTPIDDVTGAPGPVETSGVIEAEQAVGTN